ncbi:MAG: hypothetical protein H7249_04880 [Chitinophagaceae bacterium]|nr:hypothetical protein [Oligoflexus sp.]
MIPLLFILHVIGLGVILNRLPLRSFTVLGTFAYFLGFYLITGHFLAKHVTLITPPTVLQDDYYRARLPKRKSPFQSPQVAAKPKGDSNTGNKGNRDNDEQLSPGNEAISPPGMINNTRPRTDAEEQAIFEEYLKRRLKKQQIHTDSQPKTNP